MIAASEVVMCLSLRHSPNIRSVSSAFVSVVWPTTTQIHYWSSEEWSHHRSSPSVLSVCTRPALVAERYTRMAYFFARTPFCRTSSCIVAHRLNNEQLTHLNSIGICDIVVQFLVKYDQTENDRWREHNISLFGGQFHCDGSTLWTLKLVAKATWFKERKF